ncbi:uncharacterized protein [Drosophila tropicalis]|uniref:uncharacterized protein n=1 Tax=Drosophila tropicalis TaxID=46794 RepID=UPI0035AC2418
MKVNLSVDQGPCNTELRSWCLGISIFYLVTVVLNIFISHSAITFIGFALTVVANVCLLVACRKPDYKWVIPWLIYAVIVAIGFPIAILGAIFHFGGFRENTGSTNVLVAVLIYIIEFFIFAFFARLVYSYYLQLKGSDSSPRSAAVV